METIGDIEKRTEDGCWEAAPDLQQHKLLVAVEDMQIPVISLDYECEAYHRLGRPERAALVQEWLEKRRRDRES